LVLDNAIGQKSYMLTTVPVHLRGDRKTGNWKIIFPTAKIKKELEAK